MQNGAILLISTKLALVCHKAQSIENFVKNKLIIVIICNETILGTSLA